MPKLVIFDWDGTLVDSIDPILKGFELSYGRYGHPYPGADEVRATIGLPLAAAFELLTPGLPSATMVTLYREYWFDPQRPPSPWVPGAQECMRWLEDQGVLLAIATGKSRRGLEHELEAMGLLHRFAATRCAEDAQPKPHPDMVEQLLESLKVEPAQALLIGDSPLDLGMAGAAGVPAYGVLSGVGSREQLEAQPHLAILDSVAQLAASLDKQALHREGAEL